MKICGHCGTKNLSKRNSCTNCGTKLTAADIYVPTLDENNITIQNKQDFEALIGKNSNYFINEFQELDEGEDYALNWPAFLLGPIYCFYRSGTKLFHKSYKTFIWSSIAFALFAIIAAFVLNFLEIDISKAYTIYYYLFAANFVHLYICNALFAKNFNNRYYEECKDKIKNKTDVLKPSFSVKRSVVSTLILILSLAFSFALVLLTYILMYMYL